MLPSIQDRFTANRNGEAKMSIKLGVKACSLVLAAAAIAMVVVPAAEAVPVTYNFTVAVTSGPLLNTLENGSFSYDSSSVVAGGYNQQLGLLTASGFTFNGITYDDTVNTGYLGFDAAGDLNSFVIGSDCSYAQSVGYETCVVTGGSDGWSIASVNESLGNAFTYSTSSFNDFGYGKLSFVLAGMPPVSSVPEPGAFGMFGLGALMIGLFVERRRRIG